jgi:hypothetical protein
MAALGVSSTAENSLSKKEREERTGSSVFNVKSTEKLGHPWNVLSPQLLVFSNKGELAS